VGKLAILLSIESGYNFKSLYVAHMKTLWKWSRKK